MQNDEMERTPDENLDESVWAPEDDESVMVLQVIIDEMIERHGHADIGIFSFKTRALEMAAEDNRKAGRRVHLSGSRDHRDAAVAV